MANLNRVMEKIPKDIRDLVRRRKGEIIIEGSDVGGWMSSAHQPGEYTVTVNYKSRNGTPRERKLYISI